MAEDRRRVERHFFSAQAELLDPGTSVRVSTRVGDLSQFGCYLDMMNPFPENTVVRLKITSEQETFEANGRIAYAIPCVGAGAEFLDLGTKDKELLDRWLVRASGK
jgi:hypothetical protein